MSQPGSAVGPEKATPGNNNGYNAYGSMKALVLAMRAASFTGKADTDKLTRALPASDRCKAGRVWLPAGAGWLEKFRNECASFPAGAHDDQVDALAYATRVAVTKWQPPPPRPPTTTQSQGEPQINFMTHPM